MVRLRSAVMAVAIGTGVMGCAVSGSHVAHYSIWHCDECDDFPTPAYGPGDSMMPGTYTGSGGREPLNGTQPGVSDMDPSVVPPAERVPTARPAAEAPAAPAVPAGSAPGTGTLAQPPASPMPRP